MDWRCNRYLKPILGSVGVAALAAPFAFPSVRRATGRGVTEATSKLRAFRSRRDPALSRSMHECTPDTF